MGQALTQMPQAMHLEAGAFSFSMTRPKGQASAHLPQEVQSFLLIMYTYILPTILCGAGFAVVFIAFILLTNKWINDMRIYRANERLSSTQEGARLEEVRDYLDLYGALLGLNAEQAEETEETENE